MSTNSILTQPTLENPVALRWFERPQRDMSKSLVYFLLSASGILDNTETDAKGLIENFGITVVRADKPDDDAKTASLKIPFDNPKGSHYCLVGPQYALDAVGQLFEDIVGSASHIVQESGVSTVPAVKNRSGEFRDKFESKFRPRFQNLLAEYNTRLLEMAALEALLSKSELSIIRRSLAALEHVDLNRILPKDDARKLKSSLFWSCVKDPQKVISPDQFFETFLLSPISQGGHKDTRTVLDVLIEAKLFSVNMGVATGLPFNTHATQVQAAPTAPAKAEAQPVATTVNAPNATGLGASVPASPDSKKSTKGLKLKVPKPKTYTQAHLREVLANPQYDTIFLLGPSGTAKTGQALANALKGVKFGDFDMVTVIRGLQDQGRLGFLPGDEQNKLETTFRQLDGNIHFLTGGETTRHDLVRQGVLRTISPDFTMGETLSRYLIVDDAQMLTEAEIETVRNRRRSEEGKQSRIIYTADLSPDQIDVVDLANRQSIPAIYPIVAEFAQAVIHDPRSTVAQRTAFVCLGHEDVVRNSSSAEEMKMREKGRQLREAMAEKFLDQQTMEYRRQLHGFSRYFQALALEADWALRTREDVKGAVKKQHRDHLRTLGAWEGVQEKLKGPFECPDELKGDDPFGRGPG